jgi:hypothetical protein
VSELISGSQIDAWNRCQRKYHYAHDRKIAPRETSWPLAIGRAGHGVLASYYGALAAGLSHPEAVETAEGAASFKAAVLGHDEKALGHVMPLIRYAWAHWAEDAHRWQVLEVELERRIDRGDWTYIFTLDALVETRAPMPKSEIPVGSTVAVDHRFLASFYTREMASHDPQLARYALGLRQSLGRPVVHTIRNMINSQPGGAVQRSSRVKRVEVTLTQRRIEIVNGGTERTAQEIVAWRSLSMEARGILARRTEIPGDRYPSCATCEFFKLCRAEGWGEDTTELVAAEYGPTDYGNWEA